LSLRYCFPSNLGLNFNRLVFRDFLLFVAILTLNINQSLGKSQDLYEIYQDASNETNLVEIFDDLYNLDKYNLEYEIFDYSNESQLANETEIQPKSVEFEVETNKSTNYVREISANGSSVESLRTKNLLILIILFLLLQF
jgi:hypothetical protein